MQAWTLTPPRGARIVLIVMMMRRRKRREIVKTYKHHPKPQRVLVGFEFNKSPCEVKIRTFVNLSCSGN